jgi:molecular chaperone DnaK
MALEDAGVTTEDLRNFVATEEELPFPHPVPSFPLKREPGVGLQQASTPNAPFVLAPPVASAAPSFAALGERPPPHVPAHFPAFPDKHTFRATPLFDGAGGAGGRAGAAAAAAAAAAAEPTAGNLLAVAGRAGEDALVALSRRAGDPAAASVGVGGAVAAAAAAAAGGAAGAGAAPPPPLLPLAPTPALAPDDGGLDAGAAAAAAAGAPPPAAPYAVAPLPAPPRPRDKRAAAVADAATARAETILAAGSDAMGMEDKGD